MQKVLVLFKGDFSVFIPEVSTAGSHSEVGCIKKQIEKILLLKKHFPG